MTIETERLLLREMTENDLESLYRILADTDTMQYYPGILDKAEVKELIRRNIHEK